MGNRITSLRVCPKISWCKGHLSGARRHGEMLMEYSVERCEETRKNQD